MDILIDSNKSQEDVEIKYKKECLVLQKSLSTYKQTINYKDKIIVSLENQVTNLKNQIISYQNNENYIDSVNNIPNINSDFKQEYERLLIVQSSLNQEIQNLHASLTKLNEENIILKREYESLIEKHQDAMNINNVPTSVEIIKELKISKQNEVLLMERLRIAEMEIYQWQAQHDQLFNYNQAAQQEILMLKKVQNTMTNDNNNENDDDDLSSWGLNSDVGKDMLELREVLTFRQLLDGGLTNMIFNSCHSFTSISKTYIHKGYSYIKRKAIRRSINKRMLILVYLVVIHIYLLFCIY